MLVLVIKFIYLVKRQVKTKVPKVKEKKWPKLVVAIQKNIIARVSELVSVRAGERVPSNRSNSANSA